MVHSVAAVPDLLGVTARLGVDAGQICAAMDFAFAGGSCAETLASALDGCALPESDWSAECYASDLFLDELVTSCMRVRLDGWDAPLNQAFVARVIAHPPADAEVVSFRRAILAELTEDDALRGDFETLYRTLARLRQLLSHPASTSRYQATQRRIDAIGLIRDIVELSSSGFQNADSGLERIHHFAQEVRGCEAFGRLLELLDYENDLAKVEVRMQVGVDGRVRKFEIVRFAENERNRFYATPLGRLVGKLVLWWRGYRFSNDELVDRWLNHVFDGVSHFLPSLVQLMGHMEVYLASLAFRDRCCAKGLEVSFPELVDDGRRDVRGLFNPLLFAQGVVPTPCDIDAADGDRITIVTGPNSGGKTRLLQALGLTQLLAQVGLYAPVAEARLPRASGMFVSVVNDPQADQKEGRLGSELIRIRRLFEMARGGALVILDELCSGTNPSEGEEIFYLVLTLLKELEPEAFITTHFLSFARRLASEEQALQLAFLQVELDEHQRATYRFVPGVATTSLASQTAARLGVTREELMALVRRNKGC